MHNMIGDMGENTRRRGQKYEGNIIRVWCNRIL